MALAPGTKIGSYEIVALLGAGGMGEVYRARDTHLEREVAVKILAPALARDREALARFEREAKTTSSLNHPHIVHIYDIGEAETPAGPARYIAMEFVEGDSLRARFRRGQRWADLGEILVQVADALAKAHRAGVIHRDLKPENVMVSADGYAKVVDFGLAKLTEAPDADALTAMASVRTETGMIVGTVGYMSPEQAQGRPLDARSDVFSYGCILYEVVSGQRPFKGETSLATLHAIAYEAQAPLESLNPGAPAELRRIVTKCLEKDPAQRYQSIGDTASDLRAHIRAGGADAARAMPTIKTPSPRAAAMKERRTVIGWIAVGAVTAVAGVLVGNWFRPVSRAGSQARPPIHVEKVTNRGTISRVALSPDARYIAYTTIDDPSRSIWIRDVVDKQEKPLVSVPGGLEPLFRFSRNGQAIFYSYAKERGSPSLLYKASLVGSEPRLVRDGSSLFALSPDDRRLEFIRTDGDKRRLFVFEVESGQEREAGDVSSARVLGWSADGTQILIARPADGGQALVALNVERGGERVVVTEPHAVSRAWWNTTSSAIVYEAVRGKDGGVDLFTVEVATGKRAALGDRQWRSVADVKWLPSGADIVVTENDPRTHGDTMWLAPYPAGTIAKISAEGDLGWSSMSLAGDGARFAAIDQRDRCDLLVMTNASGQFRRVATGTDVSFTLNWTDSQRVVYSSNEGGSYDLYAIDADGSNRKQLTFDRNANETEPAATPDGKYIVFVSDRAGERALFRINADGTGLKQLTTPPTDHRDADPRVTPDSQWVLYRHWDNGPTLWKVPIDGGAPTLIKGVRPPGPTGFEAAYGASASPDGRSLAFFYFTFKSLSGSSQFSQNEIVVSDAGGEIQKRFFFRESGNGVGEIEHVQWSADGRAVYYRQLKDGASNLWMQPVKGGPPSQVTHFDGSAFTSGGLQDYSWSPDGKTLACTRNSFTSDVVLVSNFK